jgi:hypothetical protein
VGDLSSSIFSAAVEVTAKEYHVSDEMTTLGTSLTLLVGAHTLFFKEVTSIFHGNCPYAH